MEIIVDMNKCPKNHICPAIKVCPVNAIEQDGFDAPKINKEKCIKCKKCTFFCPKKAFTVKEEK